MSDERFLTVRDVSLLLGVSEKEVMELAESGAIPAYKVGGVYLRFKREQVLEYKKHSKAVSPKLEPLKEYSLGDRLSDFFYFNDFYILAGLIVAILLFFIFQVN